jgi:membrane protein YdbS with pleckstrin-like domain
MNLFINRDGRQLGPYTLEQARALVLSGELFATDWAWPDGAKQWIALRDVPGFASPPAVATFAPNAPILASGAVASVPIGNAPGEEELWRGHPSQVLNLKLYLGWLIVLLGLALAVLIRTDWWWLLAGGAALALISIVECSLRLRATAYVVTTQRVRVVSGLLNKNIQEIELFRVKDTMVQQWFFQRLFGLGTITILSGDARNPRLILYGIPHAVELRERLRQEVMLLRQRYNVRELDMM